MRTCHHVRTLALARGLRIADLARQADITYPTMYKIYYHPYHTGRHTTWQKLAVVLGVSVADLVESQDDSVSVSRKRVTYS